MLHNTALIKLCIFALVLVFVNGEVRIQRTRGPDRSKAIRIWGIDFVPPWPQQQHELQLRANVIKAHIRVKMSSSTPSKPYYYKYESDIKTWRAANKKYDGRDINNEQMITLINNGLVSVMDDKDKIHLIKPRQTHQQSSRKKHKSHTSSTRYTSSRGHGVKSGMSADQLASFSWNGHPMVSLKIDKAQSNKWWLNIKVANFKKQPKDNGGIKQFTPSKHHTECVYLTGDESLPIWLKSVKHRKWSKFFLDDVTGKEVRFKLIGGRKNEIQPINRHRIQVGILKMIEKGYLGYEAIDGEIVALQLLNPQNDPSHKFKLKPSSQEKERAKKESEHIEKHGVKSRNKRKHAPFVKSKNLGDLSETQETFAREEYNDDLFSVYLKGYHDGIKLVKEGGTPRLLQY